MPSYYIEESHDYIIPPDEWEAVQTEIERRKESSHITSCNSPFSSKIICGCCGAYFGSKVWQSNTKYRQTIWRCNSKYTENGKKGKDCTTLHLTEVQIQNAFISVFNKLNENRTALIDDCRLAQKTLCDTEKFDSEMTALQIEIENIEFLARQAIAVNARTIVNQEQWDAENKTRLERYRTATERIDKLEKQKSTQLGKSKTIDLFIRNINESEMIITEWNEDLWYATVESMMVSENGELTFKFKNGTEMKI
ncbi:hypothetical protein FACS1894188_13110 [Clostridia bacterium]|nr:hypothetical protein FACS1894188_13110 [Clostridia bacterium]